MSVVTDTPDAWANAADCEACGKDSCDGSCRDEAKVAERYARRLAAAIEAERTRRDARQHLDLEARGPLVLPAIETLKNRLAWPRTPVRYRIEGWLPRGGRVMVAAQHKTGKTTLVGNLIRCLVDGDLWLGRDTVHAIDGTIALLDTEMSAAQLDDWLRAQRIRNDHNVLIVPLRGHGATFNLLDERNRKAWALVFRERRVRFLILDCLRPVLDAIGIDEQREAGRFLVALDTLLSEAEIPEAALIQHMGHNGERARGDSRLLDWPDVAWKLLRQEDDPASHRFITAYGRDVDQPESQLAFDPATRRLTVAGGSRRDTKAEAALNAVLLVLATSSEALSVRGIQAALADSDHARDTIRAAIRAGVRNGSIRTEPGARGAILHRACERAAPCGTVPVTTPHSQCECASASIEARTRTLLPDVPSVRDQVTTSTFNPGTAFDSGKDR